MAGGRRHRRAARAASARTHRRAGRCRRHDGPAADARTAGPMGHSLDRARRSPARRCAERPARPRRPARAPRALARRVPRAAGGRAPRGRAGARRRGRWHPRRRLDLAPPARRRAVVRRARPHAAPRRCLARQVTRRARRLAHLRAHRTGPVRPRGRQRHDQRPAAVARLGRLDRHHVRRVSCWSSWPCSRLYCWQPSLPGAVWSGLGHAVPTRTRPAQASVALHAWRQVCSPDWSSSQPH